MIPHRFGRVLMRGAVALGASLVPALAIAHGGHGAPELSHWHATDVALLALGIVAAFALAVFTRRP